MSGPQSVSAGVDSIADGIAVLDTPAGPVRMPAALLPEGTAEGTRVTLTLSADPDGTARTRDEIREIRKRMGAGDPGPDVTDL